MTPYAREQKEDVVRSVLDAGRSFRLWLLACLLVSSAAVPAAQRSALEVIKHTSDEVIARVQSEKEVLRAEPRRLNALVDELIFPHFDFNRMGRWVLGKNWSIATEAERARFIEEFRLLLVRTYATALLEYSDRTITYQPEVVDEDGGQATVRSEIQQPGGQPVPINYRMHVKDGDWKVFDVAVEGVSLISTYRGSFADEVARSGIKGLIDSLAARNQGLPTPAPQ